MSKVELGQDLQKVPIAKTVQKVDKVTLVKG